MSVENLNEKLCNDDEREEEETEYALLEVTWPMKSLHYQMFSEMFSEMLRAFEHPPLNITELR